eukprot:4778429-Pyramimonas_sp.AAC.1
MTPGTDGPPRAATAVGCPFMKGARFTAVIDPGLNTRAASWEPGAHSHCFQPPTVLRGLLARAVWLQ